MKLINSKADEFANVLKLCLNEHEKYDAEGRNPVMETEDQFSADIEDSFRLVYSNLNMLVVVFKDESIVLVKPEGIIATDREDKNYEGIVLTLAIALKMPGAKTFTREEKQHA